MTSSLIERPARERSRRLLPAALGLAAITLLVGGCRHGEEPTRVMGWSIADPAARHPILVSQAPARISFKVAAGSHGLSPHQRAQLVDFANRYRAADAGNSRIIITAPSGGANEVASMHAVAEMRHLLREAGFDDSAIGIEASHDEHGGPIRVSYMRYVAEAPHCGRWTGNLADDPTNLPHPNLGCATQRNLAAQVANPADLLGPRAQTDRSGARRDQVWDKYVKGESTISTKQQDEKITTKGQN